VRDAGPAQTHGVGAARKGTAGFALSRGFRLRPENWPESYTGALGGGLPLPASRTRRFWAAGPGTFRYSGSCSTGCCQLTGPSAPSALFGGAP
jgi:hypothetical protein